MGTMAVGGGDDNLGGSSNIIVAFDGSVDEVAIYDHALGLADAVALYNGGSGVSACYTAPSHFSSSLFYPTNTSIFNGNYSGWINLTLSNVNQSASCQLSSPDWVEQTTPTYGNETVAFYNSDVSTAGNYSAWVYCNDSSSTINNSFWFYIQPWNITASDHYNTTSLQNFSASVAGRGVFNTTTGTITTDIPLNYASLFDINISADTYLTRGYSSQNPNETLQAELWQYQLNLYVYDAVNNQSISSFDVNASLMGFAGSSGLATLYLTAENHSINISATNYGNYSLNIEGTAETIENRTIYIQPYINISIRREKTDEPFNTSGTQYTKVFFYCPGSTIEQEFNTTSGESSIYIPVNCSWDFIKLDVIYNDTSYFRTLIPDYDERDITFYALDLTEDLGVQVILRLNDLVGSYTDGKVLISKPISSTEQYIIQQLWDMESKATLYLLKDSYYTVKIVDNDGLITRTLGSLVADAAEEKIVTVPELSFRPDKVLGTNISWDWQDTATTIRLIYNDTLDSTSSLIFSVYYSENLSLAYQTTEIGLGVGSFTYTAGNASFLACFNTTNAISQYVIYDCHIYVGAMDSFLGDWSDFDSDDVSKYLTWFGTAVVIIALLMFAPAPEWALSMAAVFGLFFMKIGWLTYGSTALDSTIIMILALLAVLGFIRRTFNK